MSASTLSALPRAALDDLEVIGALFDQRSGVLDRELLDRAVDLSSSAHAGQFRRSGDLYVTHPIAVARIVAEQGADAPSIIAALLHDVVEDTDTTLEDIESKFGPEIAMLVDGLTKLDGLRFTTTEAAQAAEMRRMLVAMAADLRVILVKLADRLHNMRTISALTAERAERIANETLAVYAPLAHRVGMGQVKAELEDLAFAVLSPALSAELSAALSARAPERDRHIAEATALASAHLAEVGIEARVEGRAKNIYSTYRKMTERQRPLDEIMDLVGIRVICTDLRDCYGALGALHGLWPPIEGRFKDYIAQPRFNIYRSLHATVIGPGGDPLEIQIRTEEMHAQAEWGIAAHWSYKEGGRRSVPDAAEIAWVGRLVEQASSDEVDDDPTGFITDVHGDLDVEEVYVFSPKGRVVTLPAGSTPVDFAYAIHTEIGHRCMGAHINGRIAPLTTRLRNGDRVEILTRKDEGTGPNPDWLGFVATHRARSKIQATINRSRRQEATESGRTTITHELKGTRLNTRKLATVLEQAACELGFADRAALELAVGESRFPASKVAARVAALVAGTPIVPTPRRRLGRLGRRARDRDVPVHVEELDDVSVRLANCCTPVPGDDIVGFIGRAGSVATHRSGCSNLADLERRVVAGEGRFVDVAWNSASTPGSALAVIEIEALDRPGLLADVGRAFAEHNANIASSQTQTGSDMVARERFTVALADAAHLESLMAALRRIDQVYVVQRGAGSVTPSA